MTSPMKRFALVLAVLSGPLTQSCSSTAVNGIPVKELGPIKIGVRAKEMPEQTKIEEENTLIVIAHEPGTKPLGMMADFEPRYFTRHYLHFEWRHNGSERVFVRC